MILKLKNGHDDGWTFVGNIASINVSPLYPATYREPKTEEEFDSVQGLGKILRLPPNVAKYFLTMIDHAEMSPAQFRIIDVTLSGGTVERYVLNTIAFLLNEDGKTIESIKTNGQPTGSVPDRW
jgi:hypothetical protein